MKALSKKVLLSVFTALIAVSCLFFVSIAFNKQVAKADTTELEAEFTNDGEFEIKTSAHLNALSYIDGATIGGTGAVLRVGNNAAVNTFRLDLTPMAVTKADITSIVVRLKADNFTLGSDEFRTYVITKNSWRQYGKTDDLSNWFEYTLNANSMGDFTVNDDGTIGYNDIGIRTNTTSLVMYVDSITVNVRDTSGMEKQSFISVFNNPSYNSLSRALLTYSGTAKWDDSDDGNLKYKMTLKNSATGETVLYANCGSAITHWAGQKWVNVALPGTYDTIIIANDAHFAGVKIPAGTLQWNAVNSTWEWEPERLSFISINESWNNDDNGYFVIQFDTKKWEQNGIPTSYSGIKYNGNDISDLVSSIRFFQEHSVWFTYSNVNNPKLTAGYNGYPFPTIEFEEGATVEYGGRTFTFNAVTFYLNLYTGKWQTKEPEKVTEFIGVDGSSTANVIVLNFSDEVSWTEETGDFKNAVMFNGSTSLTEDGGSVSLDAENKKITINANGSYRNISIAEGYVCGNVVIPAITLNNINGEWTETPVYSYKGMKIEAWIIEQDKPFSINQNNVLGNDDKYATTLDFDVKVMDFNAYPSVVNGIKINGIEVGSFYNAKLETYVIQLIDGLWFKFRNNLESGYNGYSHPTITFEYCSYVETQDHVRVYFDETELYFVNDKWQTEKPEGYVIYKPTDFVGIDEISKEDEIILKFSDDLLWANDSGNIAEHIRLDGKALSENVGSVSVNAENKTITINISDANAKYGTVSITAGALFGEVMLPEIVVYGLYDGMWVDGGHFECTDFKGWYENLPFVEIPYGWNCLKSAMSVATILRFGDYEKHYFYEQSNASNRASQVGDGITINGVSIGLIAGAEVSYAHGFNHLYISVPTYELTPTEDYKCVELRVKEGTRFLDVVLAEVVLYLVDGQWQAEKPNTVDVDAEGDYLSAEDLFNGETGGYYKDGAYILTAADDNAEIVSAAKPDANGTEYNFLYKSVSAKFNYSLYTYVGENFGGVRVAINHRQGESTQGFNVFVNGTQVGSKNVAFVSEEWYAVSVIIAVQNGQILVSVAVDGVVIILSETDFGGELGNVIKLTKSYGDLIFDNYRTGDIKRPNIDWQGKNVYKFTVGEDKPSNDVFTSVLTATDNRDKADFNGDSFKIEWENGAIENGKLVKGSWRVTASVSDKAGNSSYYTINVLVTEPNSVTVAFNVEGEKFYVSNEKGKLIIPPAVEPEKEGNATFNYIFDGWYIGDKKWDFVNDYAFEDIELSAAFTTEYKEYVVTVFSEGLDENYAYTLKLHYGVTVNTDFDFLKRDGYSYKIMKDGVETENVTVNGDTEITVVYSRIEPEPEPSKSGCGGSVNGSLIVIVLAAALAFVSLKKLSAKGGKEND